MLSIFDYLIKRGRLLDTVLFIPLIYLLGWLIVQPLSLFLPHLSDESLSIMGTVVSFILFLFFLPFWIRIRWSNPYPWKELGLLGCGFWESFKYFYKGVFFALILLIFILVPAFLGSWGLWVGAFSFNGILNGILLGLGVGFAEELIFRAWLWGELDRLIGWKWGLSVQALIFSLVHIRLETEIPSIIGLLFGLFLLGLVLGCRRRLDRGNLFGAIGLHSGLVGGWFILNAGLIDWSSNAPEWLIGHGSVDRNPLSGIVGISILSYIFIRQVNALAIAGRP